MWFRSISKVVALYFLFVSSAALAGAQQPAISDTPPAVSTPENPSGLPPSNKEYHEDFASLTRQGSTFFPILPALGQADDNPTLPFVRERWQLDWRPADPVDVFICKPRFGTKFPVILFLYTYPSTTDRFKSDDWCTTMTESGFAGVGFLSAHTGHRLDMQPLGTTFFTDFQESLAASVHDVEFLLDYLATRTDLDMTRVGLFGQGSGGTIAILASAVDARIQYVDVLTPWGDWPSFFAKTSFLSKEARAKYTVPDYLAKVAMFDPIDWMPKMKAKSFRLQNVRKTGVMPDELQERMEAAAPETTLINQYGDSAALIPHASGGALFIWIKGQLKPDTQTQVAQGKTERIHFYPAKAPENPLPPVTMPKN